MGTIINKNQLSASLFGKTRQAVLSLLYSHADETFHVRHILRVAGAGHGAVQRELKQLSDADIINRTLRGKQVYYQANTKCPIYSELKNLIIKTAGVGDLLRTALASIADRIDSAFIYGSLARGEGSRGSDVDIMIIGDVSFAEVIAQLQLAQEKLNREINPSVYPRQEFQLKVKQDHYFLKDVLGKNKIFVIGDEQELNRLAKKRLARQAPNQPSRD